MRVCWEAVAGHEDEATFALSATGQVFHWGRMWIRRLGVRREPTALPELRDVAAIACTAPGYFHGRSGTPAFATHTAAWFKLYVSEDSDPLWHSLLYNPSDPRSLCRFAPQRRCETAEEARPSRSTAGWSWLVAQ